MLILHLQVMTHKVINKSLHVKRLWLFGFFYNLFNAVCSTRKSLFSPKNFVSHNTSKVLRSCGLQAQEEEKEEDKSFYC